MSRVTGILCYYDEPIELLAASVASLIGVIDHLVAVDGAYLHYPGGKASSNPEQMRVITEICSGARIGLTTHTPSFVWSGNEVQKRNHAMRLAEPVTDENGWYLVLDADCVVTKISNDWFERLATLDDDWGAIEIGVRNLQAVPGVDQDLTGPESLERVRLMYRALRGLVYGPAHYIIHAPDPETSEAICLWGPTAYSPVDPYDGAQLIEIEHRHTRPLYRTVNARRYYETRERLGLERTTQVYVKNTEGVFQRLKS